MKLELKHLTPYLPYGLKIYQISKGMFENQDNVSDIINLTTTNLNGILLTKQYRVISKKPILKPLSIFRDVIIKNIKDDLGCSHNQVMEFLCFCDGSISLDMVTVGLYDVMCENHIDFNGLIEKGLAVDINTLDKQE